jgi:hypothetical protein
MHTPPNAHLTSLGREWLLRQRIDTHLPLSAQSTRAVWQLWRIEAVFAPPISGRSIHCNFSSLLASTVGRVLKALGLGLLKDLQLAETVHPYQWGKPGNMIHVVTKQLARFERIGQRITADRRLGPAVARAMRKPVSLATMPLALATSRRCSMKSRPRPSVSCCWLWLD